MKFLKNWLGYMLIGIALIIALCDNLGIKYNPRRTAIDKVLKLDKDKPISIKNIDIDKIFKTFYEPTVTDSGVLIQEFENIIIQEFSTHGKKGANVILIDNDYDNWKGRNQLCSFEELDEWAKDDKSMPWISWIIGAFGLILEVYKNMRRSQNTS